MSLPLLAFGAAGDLGCLTLTEPPCHRPHCTVEHGDARERSEWQQENANRRLLIRNAEAVGIDLNVRLIAHR
jgi:hypothetical protein